MTCAIPGSKLESRLYSSQNKCQKLTIQVVVIFQQNMMCTLCCHHTTSQPDLASLDFHMSAFQKKLDFFPQSWSISSQASLWAAGSLRVVHLRLPVEHAEHVVQNLGVVAEESFLMDHLCHPNTLNMVNGIGWIPPTIERNKTRRVRN